MFIENIRQRIKDYEGLRGYYQNNENTCNAEMDIAIRTAVMVIAVLIFLYITLFILSVFYAFRCSEVMKWSPITPFLLIALTFLPNFGGYFTIGIVLYGMTNCGTLCSSKSG